jgi:hypothetical protein
LKGIALYHIRTLLKDLLGVSLRINPFLHVVIADTGKGGIIISIFVLRLVFAHVLMGIG